MTLSSLCVALAALIVAPPARADDPDLADVADALMAVRATPGANQTFDAGPELTPLKNRLRAWVETRLATLADDEDDSAAVTTRLNVS